MPIQQIQLSHVRRACEMFDEGELPRRRVQSLFITVSGKTYPAYFILSLAHALLDTTSAESGTSPRPGPSSKRSA